MWFKWFKKYPLYYKASGLAACYALGAIGVVVGLICWIKSGVSDTDALTCAVAGAVVFFGFRYLAARIYVPYCEEEQQEQQE